MSKQQRKATPSLHAAVLSAGLAVSPLCVQHFPNASGNSRSWKRRTSCDTTQPGKRVWRPSEPKTQLHIRWLVLRRVERGVSTFPCARFFIFLNSCCFEQNEIRAAHTVCHGQWEGKFKGCVETCWYDLRVCGRQSMWWVETLSLTGKWKMQDKGGRGRSQSARACDDVLPPVGLSFHA